MVKDAWSGSSSHDGVMNCTSKNDRCMLSLHKWIWSEFGNVQREIYMCKERQRRVVDIHERAVITNELCEWRRLRKFCGGRGPKWIFCIMGIRILVDSKTKHVFVRQ